MIFEIITHSLTVSSFKCFLNLLDKKTHKNKFYKEK